MVPTHARMLSLASYRATASFLDSYQPRIQIQPRPLYSLLNISDILRPAMVRVRRVTVLICGSVCSRLPASHPHGFKSYNNNHFRLFLTLFSIRSTKIWRKKHSIDYLHQNDSKVDMKGFWTDFPPRVWWWWWWSGRRHKERRSFVKGFSRYIYSHHFTCFWHSTELALFILDGPCAPLECNKLEERRPNHNRWFKFVQICYREVIWQWPKLYKGSWRRDHVPMVEQVGQMLT